jgi:hypothetical protein
MSAQTSQDLSQSNRFIRLCLMESRILGSVLGLFLSHWLAQPEQVLCHKDGLQQAYVLRRIWLQRTLPAGATAKDPPKKTKNTHTHPHTHTRVIF